MLRTVKCLDYASTAEAAFLSAGGAWAQCSAQVEIYDMILYVVCCYYMLLYYRSKHFSILPSVSLRSAATPPTSSSWLTTSIM